jgi:hypothetical protein
MKTTARILMIFLIVFSQQKIMAQLTTTDPGQTAQNAAMILQNAEIIENAIKTFKQMKQMYDTGKKAYQEAVEIKEFAQRVEERLKNIGDIKALRLNKMDIIMNKVFCIKQNNYYPKSFRFLELIGQIKSAFNNCDNAALYGKTFSGALMDFDRRISNASMVAGDGIVDRLNGFNALMTRATQTTELTDAYNTRMKMELGLKYKTISDELMKLSQEVHAAINQDSDSDKNVKLSSAERMKLMDMVNQYQLQSMEYEEKSARLLKEASEMDESQKRQAAKIIRDLKVKQIINQRI